jgi:hypothetical protein
MEKIAAILNEKYDITISKSKLINLIDLIEKIIKPECDNLNETDIVDKYIDEIDNITLIDNHPYISIKTCIMLLRAEACKNVLYSLGKAHKCNKCDKLFITKKQLSQHENKKIPCDRLKCLCCNINFSRLDNFNRHLESKKHTRNVTNSKCNQTSNKNVSIGNNTSFGNNTAIGDNNNNAITINGNVFIIVPYGKENLNDLTDEEKQKILQSSSYKIVSELLKVVNFNKNKPENHNIKYNDYKSKFGKIYTDEGWELREVKDLVYDIVVKGTYDIEKILNEYGKKIDEKYIKCVRTVLDKLQYKPSDDYTYDDIIFFRKKIIDEVKISLYNNTQKMKKKSD